MKPFITLLPGMNCLQVKRNVSYIHTYIFINPRSHVTIQDICMHGLNSDRAGRYPELVSVQTVACENIRFSSLFAAGDVSAKSEEKRIFLQGTLSAKHCAFFFFARAVKQRSEKRSEAGALRACQTLTPHFTVFFFFFFLIFLQSTIRTGHGQSYQIELFHPGLGSQEGFHGSVQESEIGKTKV